jgi:hypothetical protein
MIRYSLTCSDGHGFDGWFRSSGDYESQAEKGLLACPVCGSHEVSKALMAPAVASQPETEEKLYGDREERIREMMGKVREELTKNAEDVGPRFAEVARKMHDGEMERASVYGVATGEETRELMEDGIEIHPLPPATAKGN